MEKNVTDMIGYAFQLYSLFVAASSQLNQNYKYLMDSILQSKANWEKDMKYLIPALTNFVIAMIYKYPQQVIDKIQDMQNIVAHLMNSEIRMEPQAMSIAGAIFEKLQPLNETFLQNFLFSVFSCLHFYRNNTKTKLIPVTITRAIWSCLATLVVHNGVTPLLNACNKI